MLTAIMEQNVYNFFFSASIQLVVWFQRLKIIP